MKYTCVVEVFVNGEKTHIMLDSPNDEEAVAFLNALGRRLTEHDYTLTANVVREVKP